MRTGSCDPHRWVPAAEQHGASRVLVVCLDAATPSTASTSPAETSDGAVTVVRSGIDPVEQQPAPVQVVCLGACLADATPERQRAAIHQAVQHVAPGGVLVMSASIEAVFATLCDQLGLTRRRDQPDVDTVHFDRSPRTTVHDLMWAARAVIDRVSADQLAAELAGERTPLVIDTRTHTDRARVGVIPGSIHVPRTVLEWHLDPANGYTHPAVTGLDHPLVVVCNGGYSSSLGAANLAHLGFTNVRDLVGGMRAWLHHGHPVQPPDHDHLDL